MPSMDPRTAATRDRDPEAVEFIRLCYRRRRVAWPDPYGEPCARAAQGLSRWLATDDLAAHVIGFSLFDTPALAALAARIVVEEQAARRPMTVVIAPVAEGVPVDPVDVPSTDAPLDTVTARPAVEPIRGS